MESYNVIVKIVGNNDTRAASAMMEATSIDVALNIIKDTMHGKVDFDWDNKWSMKLT